MRYTLDSDCNTGEFGYDRLNGTRKIGPSYAKSIIYIWRILDMHRTGTKHNVRHMQKSVVQWSVISKFTCSRSSASILYHKLILMLIQWSACPVMSETCIHGALLNFSWVLHVHRFHCDCYIGTIKIIHLSLYQEQQNESKSSMTKFHRMIEPTKITFL